MKNTSQKDVEKISEKDMKLMNKDNVESLNQKNRKYFEQPQETMLINIMGTNMTVNNMKNMNNIEMDT